MSIKQIRHELILLAILLFGLLLRIYNLTSESIWFDEGASIMYAKMEISQLIKTALATDFSPPLYYILLHYWIGWFGESEFTIRFLSVIFGFLGIFVIYRVGILFFSKEVSLIAAFILSFSRIHIYYSQEARCYALLFFLTLLSFYFLIKILRTRAWAASAGYVVVNILLLYTHIYSLFILAAQNFYIITKTGKHELNLWRWTGIQILPLAAFIPWIFILIKQIQHYNEASFRSAPKWVQLLNTFYEFSGSWSLLLLFLLFSFMAIVSCKKVEGETITWKNLLNSIKTFKVEMSLSYCPGIYLFLAWLLIPILLSFIFSKVSTPVYTSKYLIGSSAVIYLIVAKGIWDIFNKRFAKSRLIKIIIITALVTFSLKAVWNTYTNINKERWREVVSLIDASAESEDLVIFYSGSDYIITIFDYYSKRKDLVKLPFLKGVTQVNSENIRGLINLTEGFKRIWVVQRTKDSKGIIKEALCAFNNLLYHKTFKSNNYSQYHHEIELSFYQKKADEDNKEVVQRIAASQNTEIKASDAGEYKKRGNKDKGLE